MLSQRNIVWICVVVIMATMFYGLTPMVAEQDSVYRTYAPLVEIDALIRREYVSNDRGRGLVDGAIRGMLFELDRYSGYVSPDEMPAFQRRSSGDYIGIGLEVGVVDGVIAVIAPIDEGPAARAGIHAGDTLLAIDGQPTKDMSIFDAEGLLAGRERSSVTLRLHRVTGETDVVTVERVPVKRMAVKGFARSRDGSWDHFADRVEGLAYIRMSRFSKDMILAVDDAVRQVLADGARGLILDLRFNPGGLLTEAIETVDRFLGDGVILSTVTRRQAVDTYVATASSLTLDLPLVVLVNGYSASSAEIVAGSLQARGRATIVGQRSFGKGSVQHFIMVQNGHAGLKLTVAYYQLPGGRIIHRTSENVGSDTWGVIPDIVVPLSKAENDSILKSRIAVDFGSTGDADSMDVDGTRGEERTTSRVELVIDRQLAAAMQHLQASIPGIN